MAAAPSLPSLALLLLTAALALGGCGEAEETPIDPAPMEDLAPVQQPAPAQQESESIDTVSLGECNGSVALPFVGREADAATRAAITDAIGPEQQLRWVPQNDAVSTSIDPRRLTVFFDDEGVITALRCF